MEQSSVTVFVVDAFTNELFSGNPAAVCCLENDIPDTLKSKIAAEMNLSETAFATIDTDGSETFEKSTKFGLRWFTPSHEVDLCGHATLATAAVIFHKLGNKEKTIEFKTRSGILKAIQEGESSITLDFPINPPAPYEAENLPDIVRIVVGNLEIQEVQHSATTKKLLLRLADKYNRQDLESLSPSLQDLLAVEKSGVVKGVIVTLQANDKENFDFYSRYFAPWVGIPEDPVTGSAHTVLAPYWQTVYNKHHFRARQCSKRGGDLNIEIVEQRVKLTGQVAHVLEGTIRIK
ncbi:phenazine biosynthesis-like domain-containing protein isoform X2 [Daphnia magna]|uniref:phenazine biosynthesis-like domain-containing protein isoform X2 n=1 Tax=Daphnia magna TaxID=35525 RepID=UPI001E1BDE5F|nr:phenazine biosynthesis-like domain-containing protein isoform X2 [Daphnia magna]